MAAETAEIRTIREEIEAATIDLRLVPERNREYLVLCEAIARSHIYIAMLDDMEEMTIFDRATLLSAIGTGVQLGIDMQKARGLKKQ